MQHRQITPAQQHTYTPYNKQRETIGLKTTSGTFNNTTKRKGTHTAHSIPPTLTGQGNATTQP